MEYPIEQMEENKEPEKIKKRSNPKEWYALNKERILQKRREKTGSRKKKVYTQKNSIEAALKSKNPQTTEFTLKKYISALSLLCEVIGEPFESIITMIQFASDIIIHTIDNLKKDDDTDYSDNTKQTIYSIINPVCRIMEIELSPEVTDNYNKKMSELNFNYRHNKKKELTEVSHMSFADYIKAIVDKFGSQSLQHILALMYSEATYRDDFVNLKIIKREKVNPTNENYIIVNNTKVEVIIHTHKTTKSHGTLRHVFSRITADSIRCYILKNDLEYGMPLFPYQMLSPIIHEMNKELGIDGAISVLRQMRVYQHRNDSYENRLELARKMGHSLDISMSVYEGSGTTENEKI